jgi:uncharacterized membrane protein
MKNRSIFSIFKVLIITLILTQILILSAHAADKRESIYENVRGTVLDIINVPSNDSSSSQLKVEITSGIHKGEIITVDNLLYYNYKDVNGNDIVMKKGTQVYLSIIENPDGGIRSIMVYDYVRYTQLYSTIFIFILLLIIIGGKKGIKSLLTLLLTGAAIIKIILPSIENGMNPVYITMLVCIVLLIVNLVIISGFNKKTLAAIIGTVSGVLSSSFLAIIIGNSMRVIGVSDNDAETLLSLFPRHNLNLKGILFSGILLGTLGALIDIGISISSAMSELQSNNPNISKKNLIRSGMNIGRDIIGAMSNTLILAYAGSSLVVLLSVLSTNMSLAQIINQDVIASEIFKALIGSIGLMLTVPFTVFAMAQLKTIRMFKE